MGMLLNNARFVLQPPMNRGHALRTLSRILRWQLASRLAQGFIAVPFVDDTRLLVRTGMSGATGNIYCGLHEFEDMGFVLHALRPDDFFVDVGAHVGSYTILAAACGARVCAIEPSPQHFRDLSANVKLNNMESVVRMENVAAGERLGTVRFTRDWGSAGHVLGDHVRDSIAVRSEPLDFTLMDSPAPTIVKIDVEGFETAVVNGATETLGKAQAVVMELDGSGPIVFKYDEHSLRARMLDFGFTPCSYEPLTRKLTLKNARSINTLYVRDIDAMRERVRSAPTHRVHGRVL